MPNTLVSIMGLLTLAVMSSLPLAANDEQNLLHLTPSVCIIDAATSHCRIQVQFHWQTSTNNAVCIQSVDDTIAPWCNQDPNSHTTVIEVQAQADMQFLLVDKATHQILADAKFTVTSPNQTSERRRYRNPWSLF
ncbi:MAG: DUF3019 domain-containing protein [Shewanella sp.]|uniref:DUF3019 domain-containing protein n=1 Tax=Shewanella sp. SNU WT4 TaxID=2590015 RepID=UPI00112D548E|nr:DUF3019 domain-containing protein [Shewanella sp. SNU WT4]QDF66194.1 DUF3019 domain-containing protein [Shewanella sp. SNU WT4]